MAASFKTAMAKLAVVGQDTKTLTDCSEVIPPPKFNLAATLPARLPPGKTLKDIEFSVCFILLQRNSKEVIWIG
jgi:hypothetical protein